MAGRIKVTPEELRSQARAYTNGAQTVEGVLHSLDSANNQISSEWEGQAFRQYMQQYQQLSQKVKQFDQLLIDINRQLDNAANTLEQTDQQLSKGFGFN
ncbi:WXG100 family type VII secretion target [Furfurilactobacillus rossiae]|uniref:ESAT-6-like protein n=1 Tax=Furfurilactobacillus rossiae DSM 15814 TaxID=1114972 RepID=A0A0R1R6Z8_9LACO|nr:WXG100 family type VII secretion target [Furfurilactobacillus rossiae]KRL52529.1 hypothetical protein FD35_GL001916 [Furfurilactobacillus rossiae DSM 15814]QFR67993.1 WXG100 family type VII secretion target [Furfurilactobacillus rossiae]QLE60986.1 ESAT-6-Esx secreted protein EsxA-YukE [Furfurilactobacillus rossiae]